MKLNTHLIPANKIGIDKFMKCKQTKSCSQTVLTLKGVPIIKHRQQQV